jgi:competence CoiA-like predicted nuclease
MMNFARGMYLRANPIQQFAIRTFWIWESRHWDFDVSAEMHQQLKQEIEQLPDNPWHLRKMEKGGVIREWAKVPYVPARKNEKKTAVLIVMWRSKLSANRENFLKMAAMYATMP